MAIGKGPSSFSSMVIIVRLVEELQYAQLLVANSKRLVNEIKYFKLGRGCHTNWC